MVRLYVGGAPLISLDLSEWYSQPAKYIKLFVEKLNVERL